MGKDFNNTRLEVPAGRLTCRTRLASERGAIAVNYVLKAGLISMVVFFAVAAFNMADPLDGVLIHGFDFCDGFSNDGPSAVQSPNQSAEGVGTRGRYQQEICHIPIAPVNPENPGNQPMPVD